MLLQPPNSGFREKKKKDKKQKTSRTQPKSKPKTKKRKKKQLEHVRLLYLCFIDLIALFRSQRSALELLSHPKPSYILGHQQSPGYNPYDRGKQFLSALWFTGVCHMCGISPPQHLLLTALCDPMPLWIIIFVAAIENC